jgi:hypothetical protein
MGGEGRRTACGALAVILLAACSGGSSGGARPSPPADGTGAHPVQARCRHATPIDRTRGNELHGTTRNGELWGIAMGEHVPPRVGDRLKIVWRMTGHGDVRVTTTRPDGTTARLTFGPDPHGASTYTRPGDEWGTGFHFDEAGCWTIHLARADTSGSVWLEIS